MLILSRKEGERIMIGDGVTIEVAEIRGDQVRLAIAADRAVAVHREEVAVALKLRAEGRGDIGPGEVKRRLAAERGTLDRPRRERGGEGA